MSGRSPGSRVKVLCRLPEFPQWLFDKHSPLTVAGAAVALGPELGHLHHIPSFIPKRFAPVRGTLHTLFAGNDGSGSSGFATPAVPLTARSFGKREAIIAISCG